MKEDIEERAKAVEILASHIIRAGYTIKGGFVRDFVIFGERCFDLDVCSGVDATTPEGVEAFRAAFDSLMSQLQEKVPHAKFLTDLAWRSDKVCSMKCTHGQKMHWVIEVQFIARKHSQLYPMADLTCNNLALKASASGRTFELVLAGESHLNLEATLVLTKRKEFGIQSGSVIPRVLQRAATRKLYGWIQVPVDPVDRSEQFEFSENQLYLKSKGMLPTTELPVAFSVELTWIMVQQKEEVIEELKEEEG